MAKPGQLSAYKPSYCDKIIQHMETGRSLVSFAASVGVCRDTVHEWTKVHKEFSDAKKRAVALSQDYWEDVLARGTLGEIKGFNVVGAIFLLKNRFGEDWREKQDVNHTGKLTLEDLVAPTPKTS